MHPLRLNVLLCVELAFFNKALQQSAILNEGIRQLISSLHQIDGKCLTFGDQQFNLSYQTICRHFIHTQTRSEERRVGKECITLKPSGHILGDEDISMSV